MKKTGLLLSVIFILSACGTSPTPAAPVDTQATVAAMAGTMIASTLTAQPSATTVPTETALPSETPTILPVDTASVQSIDPALVTPTIDPSLAGVASPTVWVGNLAPGNIEGLEKAILLVRNNTGVKEIIITITNYSETREQTVYYSYKVTGFLAIEILVGRVEWSVQIPNKRIMSGKFSQQSKDKTTMRVELQKVVITGP